MQNTKLHQGIQSSVSSVECYVCGKGLSKVTVLQLRLCPTELYYFVMFTIQCNSFKNYFKMDVYKNNLLYKINVH